jgi:aconitate hydratase
VVTDYLAQAGLQPYLDELGFQIVGYGCTTCIGNSGPLHPKVEEAINTFDLVAASVLSGNRNFEARVHQNIKANFLMSPPLVVAFALAGRVDVDLSREPLGRGRDGREVYLRDIWPTLHEVRQALAAALKPEVFRRLYADFAEQNPKWNEIPSTPGDVYAWDESSDYIQEPPFFLDFAMEPGEVSEISGARPLGIFGDSVTTDHISPAGAIKATSPAGKYLISRGVAPKDFNSYGSRRGNDRVMTRGTFANVRIKNLMVPGVEGGVTMFYTGTGHKPGLLEKIAELVHPDGTAKASPPGTKLAGEQMSIFDAAVRYAESSTPLLIFAGQEYGTGSSRDWAAKGTRLLGVRAVVAASFERIHRSNLVGMGVLPLQFLEGVTAQTLGLDGSETFDLQGLSENLYPGQMVTLVIRRADGTEENVQLRSRIDTAIEVDYYRHGGILPYVLRELLARR